MLRDLNLPHYRDQTPIRRRKSSQQPKHISAIQYNIKTITSTSILVKKEVNSCGFVQIKGSMKTNLLTKLRVELGLLV